jgi:hypothetical protein
MKLLDILTEISINADNFYPYNLSRGIYRGFDKTSATFTTENGYEYIYSGTVLMDKILDVSFKVSKAPPQAIGKFEKSINNIWVRLDIEDDNYTKELLNLETNKGTLNTNYINWNNLSTNKRNIEFIDYIKSKFSAFNGKPIDLNQFTSYNILFYSLFDIYKYSVYGFKVTSGNQELIIDFNENYKNTIEIYYKLNLKELDGNLLSYIKPKIQDFAADNYIGYGVNTNDGNVFKVMTTIFHITKEIFNSNDELEYLSFDPVTNSGEKNDTDLDQSKRGKLYNLYVNQFYPKSYKVTGDEFEALNINGVVYKIIK